MLSNRRRMSASASAWDSYDMHGSMLPPNPKSAVAGALAHVAMPAFSQVTGGETPLTGRADSHSPQRWRPDGSWLIEVRVWDLAVRIFHWALVAGVCIA